MVACKNRKILVDKGCLWIVVAGSNVGIAPDSIAFLSDYKTDFCMNLKVYDSVDNDYPRLLQFFCPRNVSFFIKACLEFNKDRDLLSVLCRLF